MLDSNSSTVRDYMYMYSRNQFKREHKSYYKLTRGGGLKATGSTKYSLGTSKYSLGTSVYASSKHLSNTKVKCPGCGNIFFAAKTWSPHTQNPRVDVKNIFGFLGRRALSPGD